MHLSTQSLRVFLNVVEQGSLSKAARVLYMSQPSVSVHVRELETSLGTRLLDRSPTGVTPTAAGAVLAERAREVLAIIGGIDADIDAAEGLGNQRLAVGVTGTLGHSLLPSVLTELSAAHPDLRVELRVGNAKQVEQWVLDREIGVGVCAGKIDRPQLRSSAILDEALALVASPDHPLAAQQRDGAPVRTEQLAAQRFLLREMGSATRADQELALAMWGCPQARAWTVWSAEAALECVRAGVGLTLVSEHVVARELATGSLVALDVDRLPPRRPVTVIRLAGTRLRPIEEELVRLLTELDGWSERSLQTPARKGPQDPPGDPSRESPHNSPATTPAHPSHTGKDAT